jgi:hypothetical protein
MYLNTLNAAVKCSGPGFIRKCDNLEIAKAISGLKSIAVYNKKPISSWYHLMSLFDAIPRNFNKKMVNMGINAIYELSLTWNLTAIFSI